MDEPLGEHCESGTASNEQTDIAKTSNTSSVERPLACNSCNLITPTPYLFLPTLTAHVKKEYAPFKVPKE